MKIYFAGKIAKYDWRHKLLHKATQGKQSLRGAEGPFEFEVDKYKVIYNGPFFQSCDHGCFHGTHMHGILQGGFFTGCMETCDGVRAFSAAADHCADAVVDEVLRAEDTWGRRTWLHKLCSWALQASDLVFCHVDTRDCFGTLVELGEAFALGKRVHVNFANTALSRDMWFAATCGSFSVIADPYDALLQQLRSSPPVSVRPATHQQPFNLDDYRLSPDMLRSLQKKYPRRHSAQSAKDQYAEALRLPLWQKKRLKIMERDNWTCVRCGEKSKPLHVHHKHYLSGAMPWEYPDDMLETLCETCHENAHGLTLRPLIIP